MGGIEAFVRASVKEREREREKERKRKMKSYHNVSCPATKQSALEHSCVRAKS